MIDFVNFNIKWVYNIMVNKVKIRMSDPVLNISFSPCVRGCVRTMFNIAKAEIKSKYTGRYLTISVAVFPPLFFPENGKK